MGRGVRAAMSSQSRVLVVLVATVCVLATPPDNAVSQLEAHSGPVADLGETSKEKWGFGGITTSGSFMMVAPSFELGDSEGDRVGGRRRKNGSSSPPPPPPPPPASSSSNNVVSCQSWKTENMNTAGSDDCLFRSDVHNQCLDSAWYQNSFQSQDFMKDGKPKTLSSSGDTDDVVAEVFGVLKVSGEDPDQANMGIAYLRRS